MIYVDFDGVLFNTVQRALDDWSSKGWHTGTYEEWTHWNKFQDWGLPSFRPIQDPFETYSLDAEQYVDFDLVEAITDARDRGVEITILTHCTGPIAAKAKEAWCRYYLGDIPFISVPDAEDKANYSEAGNVLVDDYDVNCREWEEQGGAALMPARPWNSEGQLPIFHVPDEYIITHLNCADGPNTEQDEQESVLEEAARLVSGDRQNQYGPADQDFRRTADMWNALFGGRGDGESFRPQDVALAMICIKLSRQTHQNKRDNWVDLAGYAHCGNLCQELEGEN